MTLSLRYTITTTLIFISLLTTSSATAQINNEMVEIKTSANGTTTNTNQPYTSTTTQRQEDSEDEIGERREERLENIENRQILRQERAGALTTFRQTRILNLSANISNRMDAAVGRLFAIIGRLEQRIMKLQQAGVATSEAEAELRAATLALTQAQSRLSDIDARVTTATTSDRPYEAWQSVKAYYQETGQLIRQSHAGLKVVISLLKTAPTISPSNISSLDFTTVDATSSVIME